MCDNPACRYQFARGQSRRGIIYEEIEGQNHSSPVDDVLRLYLGPALTDVYNAAHVGRRGLILWACGPAMRNENLKRIISLVEHRHFDFVVGFGGDGVLAYVTCPSILQFISLVSDYTTSDIFDIAVDCFGERDVVSLHPVIVISRAPVKGPRQDHEQTRDIIHCRQIAYSTSFDRCWGMTFKCLLCAARSPDLDVRSHRLYQGDHERIHFTCKRCLWHILTLYFSPPPWVHRTHRSFVFWHDYPPPEDPELYLHTQLFSSWLKDPHNAEALMRFNRTPRGAAGLDIRKYLVENGPQIPRSMYPKEDDLKQGDASIEAWLFNRPNPIRNPSNAQASRLPNLHVFARRKRKIQTMDASRKR